jgi:hypothetical protein
MVEQREEKRQVGGIDALFVQGQDEGTALGAQQVVGILDSLGDAFARDRLAKRIVGEEAPQLVIGNVGVDSHTLRLTGVATRGAAGACATGAPRIKWPHHPTAAASEQANTGPTRKE